MRKGLTEVVFILDRSGSMRGLEEDTIGGFNSMIEKQRKEEGEVLISTVLFDSQCEVLYDRVPVDKIEPMNDSRCYTYDKVKRMVEKEKQKYGWEFLFLGANIDAIQVAARFGIGADRALNYESDSAGTVLNYQVLSETVSAVRRSRNREEMNEAFSCCDPIREDYRRRHKE